MSPDRRRHRGAHPDDRRLFAPERLPTLRAAVAELSWLLGKGYTLKAAVKLVGDRHELEDRQRLAVARASCSDEQRLRRIQHRLALDRLVGAALIVDGFNLLITIEAALSGGVLLRCRDGCVRDLASVHSTYRDVEETQPAVERIGAALAAIGVAQVHWLFDRPVGNSGRIAGFVRDLAQAHGWRWTVDTALSPDREVAQSSAVAITSDSNILDIVQRWFNLADHVLERHVDSAWLIDLAAP